MKLVFVTFVVSVYLTCRPACIELETFKRRRVMAFKKNLVALAELQTKHAKVKSSTLVCT